MRPGCTTFAANDSVPMRKGALVWCISVEIATLQFQGGILELVLWEPDYLVRRVDLNAEIRDLRGWVNRFLLGQRDAQEGAERDHCSHVLRANTVRCCGDEEIVQIVQQPNDAPGGNQNPR